MITYFIQFAGFVKIGKTGNLQNRFTQLSVAFPTEPKLLKASDIPEYDAHRIASTLTTRARGEWFVLNPALAEWIHSIEDSASERATFRVKKQSRAAGSGAIRVNISINPDIHAMAKEMADSENMSLSTWLEQLVRGKMEVAK